MNVFAVVRSVKNSLAAVSSSIPTLPAALFIERRTHEQEVPKENAVRRESRPTCRRIGA
jgi:hypothetical protein